MTDRAWESTYDSHTAFYEDVYGQYLTGTHQFGNSGAAMLEAVQSAGDWSDAPTPDLVVAWLASEPVGFDYDLGAGRFSGRQKRGDIILIAPGASTTIHVHAAHRLRLLAVPYAGLLNFAGVGGQELPSNGDFGDLHGGLLRCPEVHRLLDTCWREASGGGPQGSLYADSLVLQIAATLSNLRRPDRRRHATGGLAPWQVKRVTDYLEARLAEDVSLDELSRLLGLSTFHLCRAFKRSTGLPPHRWRLQRRIERSCELLRETNLSITEVAAAVGYDDPSQLAAAFRKTIGASPSEYRRQTRS